jgi:hypothetical protein
MKVPITADHQKAAALRKMAELQLLRISQTSPQFSSIIVKDYYDMIHQLCEAISLEQGFKCKGEGAHAELIDFVSRQYLTEGERIFLQQLRDYRNRISYEGFVISQTYLLTNLEKIKLIIELLQRSTYRN